MLQRERGGVQGARASLHPCPARKMGPKLFNIEASVLWITADPMTFSVTPMSPTDASWYRTPGPGLQDGSSGRTRG